VAPSLRFQCPNCKAVLEGSTKHAGSKIACLNCGQRLRVPHQLAPPPPTSKTVLAPIVGADGRVPSAVPASDAVIELPSSAIVGPAPSGKPSPPALPAAAPSDLAETVNTALGRLRLLSPETKKHSGLGIASFVIALSVGAWAAILVLLIVAGFASREAGLVVSPLLQCMTIVPVCLPGAALGVVGLLAQRDRAHLFTWLGLLGNIGVMLAIIALFVFCISLGRLMAWS